MLLQIRSLTKSIGTKKLFEGLRFSLAEGEKAALIGRNGSGKTTLFRIIAGQDDDFNGKVDLQKGRRVIYTQQEHFLPEEVTAYDYITQSIPEYDRLYDVVFQRLQVGAQVNERRYLDAVSDFTERGYYSIEEEILQELENFQISLEQSLLPLRCLSGGEKKFVELVRVMFSQADLALIDEPTNHMDTYGKKKFLEWLHGIDQTVLTISHDRDVLKEVNRILELKELKIFSFPGNYDDYLQQNSTKAVTDIHKYEVDVQAIRKLEKQIEAAKKRKGKARSNKGRGAAKIQEVRLTREKERLEAELKRPHLWVDRDSLEKVPKKVLDAYAEYKEENIGVGSAGSNRAATRSKRILSVRGLVLGYDTPLFEPVDFELLNGSIVRLKGRNGVGKSTLLRYIIPCHKGEETDINAFCGEIDIPQGLRLGVYEQEINEKYLDLSLTEALREVYYEEGKILDRQGIKNLLDDYLFDADLHSEARLGDLSGGEKARFQLIRLLLNDPNLIILDEPTNHLDLPSIEELEDFLSWYVGAVLYVSHDSYFAKNLPGEEVEMVRSKGL